MSENHQRKGIRRTCTRCGHTGSTYASDEGIIRCMKCDGNYIDLYRYELLKDMPDNWPDKRPETKIVELEKRIKALEDEKQSSYTIDNLIINVSDHVDIDKIAKALQDKVERTVRRTYREGSN